IGAMLVQTLNQELIIPRLAERGLLMREVRDATKHDISAFEVRLVSDAAGNRYYAAKFDKAAGVLSDLHVWRRESPTGRVVDRISAPTAAWTGPEADKGSGGYWNLEQATVQPLRLATAGAPADPSAGAEHTTLPSVPLKTDLDPTNLTIKRY